MNKDNIAIKVDSLSKTFKLPHEKSDSLKSVFTGLFSGKKTYETQEVLKNISFDVEKGDFFGIVGRNGSGKSTLLKLLAGIYKPSSGHIGINGKLTPFIELGVGFNPELTGRENVFLNGALLGFSRKEMQAMYQDIVEFSELERFMDQKLKNYSSGMQVRLAFSIAIKAKNEILIFDEVLAVGDEAFQRKCLDVFEQYKAEKQTVILVTHDMETVKQFCNRAMLISNGDLVDVGDPHRIADTYSRLNQREIDLGVAKKNLLQHSAISARIVDLSLRPKSSFETGEDAYLDIGWTSNKKVRDIVIDIFKMSGEHVGGFKATKDKQNVKSENSSAKIKIKLNIAPGRYYFHISTRTKDDTKVDTLYRVSEFTIIKNWKRAGVAWSGLTPIDHEWVDIS